MTLHLAPSQRSIRVNTLCVPESRIQPTAVTSVGDTACTLVRTFALRSPVLIGFGLGTTDQIVPSKCSTSVLTGELGATRSPTAQMSVGEVAEIDHRKLPVLLALGLATSFHEVPSQCSMSVF